MRVMAGRGLEARDTRGRDARDTVVFCMAIHVLRRNDSGSGYRRNDSGSGYRRNDSGGGCRRNDSRSGFRRKDGGGEKRLKGRMTVQSGHNGWLDFFEGEFVCFCVYFYFVTVCECSCQEFFCEGIFESLLDCSL